MTKLSKSQIHLMEIGQMALGNFHDIYRDLNNIGFILREDNSTNSENIKRSISKIKENLKLVYDLKRFDEHITSKITFSSLKERLEKFYKMAINVELINDFEFQRPLAPVLQVLLNLINNAIKHSQGNNVKIVFKDNTVTISDDGKGIPQDVQDRMYEMGFTTDLENRELAGCGLYSVKVLCDKFDIGLSFKNGMPLKGANFMLSF